MWRLIDIFLFGYQPSLTKGLDLNAEDTKGRLVLHIAAIHSRSEIFSRICTAEFMYSPHRFWHFISKIDKEGLIPTIIMNRNADRRIISQVEDEMLLRISKDINNAASRFAQALKLNITAVNQVANEEYAKGHRDMIRWGNRRLIQDWWHVFRASREDSLVFSKDVTETRPWGLFTLPVSDAMSLHKLYPNAHFLW